jgi:hypothetical protein
MVDLPQRLKRLVHIVNKGQANAFGLDLKLRQDGVGKGFGGYTGSIGNKKCSAVRHV